MLMVVATGVLMASRGEPLPLQEMAPVVAPDDSSRVTRYTVRRTGVNTQEDLKETSVDLKDPENVKTEAVYDDKTDTYQVGTSLQMQNGNGGTTPATTSTSASTTGFTLGTAVGYLNAPVLMTPQEYQQWTLRQSMSQYFRKKNQEQFETQGKDKFDFTDMHFNLGPAEKIFGPGGVQIKTQGSAELKMGVNLKNIDNPALAVSRRSTAAFNFDEKINLTLNGKVGDKVNLNLNYNTDATFDFDSQNLKLKYDGKEDEIIKLVEVGNVSFPSNVGLVSGLSSLFGARVDAQFGKLKLQTVISQKKSASSSVSSKGGKQTTPFEFSATNYEENRHFFLSHFFRKHFDRWMESIPTITSGVSIKRVEIWVTNKSANTESNRNVIAFADLGEESASNIHNPLWTPTGSPVPANRANSLYQSMVTTYAKARDISRATSVLDAIPGFEGTVDYEKLQNARRLSSTEYTINNSLGYVSLSGNLQVDDILAIAYEYTYGGVTYQVGEFAQDVADTKQALYVKLLKGTTGSPQLPYWRLMMKNVYNLGATTVQKDQFRLDVKYQSDSTGVYLTYLPHPALKDTTLLTVMGLDRLDDKNNVRRNGQFDYVEGLTILKGRVIFPYSEPFGEHLRQWVKARTGSDELAGRFAFTELYDSTKVIAKQIAEHDKYQIVGRYKGNAAGEIDLGVTNVAQGSVVVTAGGVRLTENTDYTVDYNMGRVTIINQSLLDAGTNINASVESNDTYGMQRKTVLGLNADYEFNKNLTFGGTLQYLTEQPLTTKVNMGSEPLKNFVWGAHLSWKHESQWLTDMIDKLPIIHATQPSRLTLNAEVAQLVAGQNTSVQGQASYLDDFESSSHKESLTQPTYWMLSSTPSMFPESHLTDTVVTGFNRATLAWYSVDPIFTRRSSTLTPSHIKSDVEQLSNHYIREIYERELYPQKAQNSYSSAANIPALNVAYYPRERGAYNLSTDVSQDGKLLNPESKWGGMMRRIENTDFEAQNIQYIEFWMMDPFIYTRDKAGDYSGDFYINLGEISEDVLKDGKKFFESGMPIDGNPSYYEKTTWGHVPNTNSVTYGFNNEAGARAMQDLGLNGLNDNQERNYPAYAKFLKDMEGKVNAQVYDSLLSDPANDNYHYYRGTDFDQEKKSIMDRYKRVNLPQGNSADSETSPESYETAWKSTPDVEDINQDYTLNEYEKYYQYRIHLDKNQMEIGQNYIVEKRTAIVNLRNEKVEPCTWYLFRVPIREYEKKVGSINDFTSIRFMRLFLTGFKEDIVLRFATMDLVHGDWRPYQQALYAGETPSVTGTLEVSTVNIEENNDKEPVNYVLPPGISRVTDPTQTQLAESNEQAMSLVARNLSPGDARAVYKNCNFDMRRYRHLQMFVHANALKNDITDLQNGETSIFIRLGSDYKNNFYEYEVPLQLTPEGQYDTYSPVACRAVWPAENMIDTDLDVLTELKKERNKRVSMGLIAQNELYTGYDPDKPSNRIAIMGNPTLGEVKTIMVGVRNNGRTVKSVEVWANELRLQEFTNEGGWAAQGDLNLQLSDIGSFNARAQVLTAGFGGLEQSVSQRRDEDQINYSFSTTVELGRLLPDAVKLTAPLYYSYSKETIQPKYNPFDSDMLMKDALDALGTATERDSLKSLTNKVERSKNISFSGVRFNIASPKHPMPYDPANFTFAYSHQLQEREGQTTVYERQISWRGSINYAWTPNWKPWEPFKNIKGKSKWLDLLKAQNISFAPQSLSLSTDLSRTYYELQERDLEDVGNKQALPLNFSSNYLWNRHLQLRWDIFKSLHFNYQSGTRAEIEEPNVPVNKDLYPDQYEMWKDSVKASLARFGSPLDYTQQVQASYKVPFDKIPITNWISADASYNSAYTWRRGSKLQDGSSLGNTINTQRNVNLNGRLDLEKLYNVSPFLQAVNKRFSATNARNEANKKRTDKKARDEERKRQKKIEEEARQRAEQEAAKTGVPVDSILSKQPIIGPSRQTNAQGVSPKKSSKKGYSQEVRLLPDTIIEISHGQNSKRVKVTALDMKGHPYKLKTKTVDENRIRIIAHKGDSTKVRLNVVAKPPLEDNAGYTFLQAASRFLMMVRNVSVSYRNTYNLALPGFLPSVGAAFGQKTYNGILSPGLDFAFGMVDDSYIDEAKRNGWLLCRDDISTPATSATAKDLQVKMSLEPLTDVKIDLNMSYTDNRNKSIQFMYEGSPTTLSGSFNMTTISIGTAFASTGSASNGYYSKPFKRFRELLDVYQQRVEQQYIGTYYPKGTGMSGPFDPKNGTVSRYSPDVMVPAFLNAYTSIGGKDIFPALTKMLPNWMVNYRGLSNLPFLRDVCKSVTLTHGYKSVYAVGSYNSYSSWIQSMTGGGLGFIENTTTGTFVPSSQYDVSSVSINESFAPLVGLNFTFNNNMTLKAEYRTTRVLALSMTSAQLNESSSKDIVIGWGWKINDFRFSSLFGKGRGKASSQLAKNNRSKTKGKPSTAKNKNDNESQTISAPPKNSKRGAISHDLNLRFDFSIRNQSAIRRDLQTNLCEATSGNMAVKTSAVIDYTVSRFITMSLFYDRQSSQPLLSTSSYPTVTQDFGMTMKVSLTR